MSRWRRISPDWEVSASLAYLRIRAFLTWKWQRKRGTKTSRSKSCRAADGGIRKQYPGQVAGAVANKNEINDLSRSALTNMRNESDVVPIEGDAVTKLPRLFKVASASA